MNTFLALLGVAVIPPLTGLLLPKKKDFFKKDSIRGFGLGVYIALVILLFKESIEYGGGKNTLIWFFVGLVFSIGLGLYFKEFHHHHEHNEKDQHDHTHTKTSLIRLLISDFFHNIIDGIAIIASFKINPAIGLNSFLGILMHQTIQQGGQQVLLVESGTKPKKAIFVSVLISLSVFLGFLFSGNELIETIFTSLSSGIIAWKIGVDMKEIKWTAKTILGLLIGGLLLTLSLVLIPHQH